jgi:hypothetical protein
MSQSQRPTETVAVYCENHKRRNVQLLYVTAGGAQCIQKKNTAAWAHTVRYQQIVVSVYENNTVVRVYTVQ